MSTLHHVRVHPLPTWIDAQRLLGPGAWQVVPLEGEARSASARLAPDEAADLLARLRGVGFGGAPLQVEVDPPLSRALVRAGRTAEARRLRVRSPGFLREGTRCDEEGRWSLTPEPLALQLGRRARGSSVFDAGCGVGGNAIGFARAGCAVTAVERDPARLRAARHNARVYGVAERIAFLEGDAVALVGTTQAQLLFVDPPWGRQYDKRRVVLQDLPLLEALWAERARFEAVWAKVPASFDPTSAIGARPEAVFGVGPGDERRVKFLLLRFGR